MNLPVRQAWTSADTGAGTGSISITWGTARAVGALLVLCVNSDSTEATPSGWTLARSQVNNSAGYIHYRIATNDANDGATFASAFSKCIAWAEYGNNTSAPLDVVISAGSGVPGTGAFSTGTTAAATAQADELGVAFWGYSASGVTGGNFWSSYTNGYVEQLDIGTTKGAGANVGLAVAVVDYAAISTKEASATNTGSLNRVALLATFTAAPANPNVSHARPFPYRPSTSRERGG